MRSDIINHAVLEVGGYLRSKEDTELRKAIVMGALSFFKAERVSGLTDAQALQLLGALGLPMPKTGEPTRPNQVVIDIETGEPHPQGPTRLLSMSYSVDGEPVRVIPLDIDLPGELQDAIETDRTLYEAVKQIDRAFGVNDVEATEARIRKALKSATLPPICGTCGKPEGYCGQC